MNTLPHSYDPHAVAAHLLRTAPFVTRESDYLFDDGADVAAAIAAVLAGDPVPQPAPTPVPAHHLRRALRAAGMLAGVKSYMDTLPDDDEMREAWEYAPYFRRDANGIEAARVALGLTVAQVDHLFRLAGRVVT